MRALFLAALLSSTALVASAAAQTQPTVTPDVIPQGEAQGRAAAGECERLADLVSESGQANAGVTVEQAQEWKQAGNGQACHDNLERIKQAAAAGSSGAGIKPVTSPAPQPQAAASGGSAPAAAAAGAAPGTTAQVVVQQAQPNVTVRQQQPEIIVRLPPPVITVQQPQPEIIVRMPPPDVNVSMVKPEIQVTMPQPQVQVVPPQQAQPQVRVDGHEPQVRVERTGEPQVIYQQAQGQPQVRFEPMGGQAQASSGNAPASQAAPALTPQAAQAQLNGGAPKAGTEPQLTGALPAATRTIDVAKLEEMILYNAAGEKLGDVEEVVSGPGDKLFVVVAHGGFLGLGEKQVALPVDRVALRGDRLVAEGMSDEQIKAMPAYDDDDQAFKETQGGQTVPLRVLQP